MNKKPERHSVEVLRSGTTMTEARLTERFKVSWVRCIAVKHQTQVAAAARAFSQILPRSISEAVMGSNTDTSQLTPGDYKFSTTATSGGGIEFTETKGHNGKKDVDLFRNSLDGHLTEQYSGLV